MSSSAWPCSDRPRACARCGYAVDVLPVAVLVAGRIELERRLCGSCRRDLVETLAPIEPART